MSFSINLYNNNSEKNKIGKSLTNYGVLTGTLKNECSLTSPEVLVQSDKPILCNYAYIPNFGRYYFVTDVVSVRNNMYILKLKCDVLESFKSKIYKNTAVLERSQYYWNLYLQDASMPIASNILTNTQAFNVSFNKNGTKVLIYNEG